MREKRVKDLQVNKYEYAKACFCFVNGNQCFSPKEGTLLLRIFLDSARNFRVHIGWSHLIRCPSKTPFKVPFNGIPGTKSKVLRTVVRSTFLK